MQNITDNINEYEHLAFSVLEEFGLVIDYKTYEILYMNQVGLQLFNLTQDNYKGRKYHDIICGSDGPCKNCKNSDLSEDEFKKIYHYNPKTGQHLAIKSKIETIDGRKCVIATGVDISNEDNKKKELELLSNLDKSIIKCADTLLKESGQSMHELMVILVEYYYSKRACIFELDYDTMTLNCIADHRIGEYAKVNKSLENIPFDFNSEFGRLLTTKEYVYAKNLEDVFTVGTAEYNLLKEEKTTNFLSIPLSKNGKFFGFIGVEELANYDNDPSLLIAVAAFVINNIYKNRALKELQHTKNELTETFEKSQTLAECATFLLEETDVESSINSLLETVCNYYGGEASYIFEWEESEKELKNDFHYATKDSNFVPIKEIDTDVINMWVNIVKDKNMFFMTDIEKDLDHNSVEYKFLKGIDVNSMILVPLLRDGVKTGLLGCDNITRNLNTPELLYSLAGFIMNDVEKKELIDELEVLSYTDKLTGLYNRNYYLHLIEQHKLLPSKEFGIIFADVNGLKKANDNLGHEYGDILLKWCADYLKKNLNSSICRIGGDEFVCFGENVPAIEFDLCVSTMRSTLKKMPHQCMSIGSTWSDSVMDINKQIIETDKMMYLEKQHYYALLKERNADAKSEIEHLKKAILDLEEEVEQNYQGY